MKTLILALLFSTQVYAQQTAVEITYGSTACEMKEADERGKMLGFKTKANDDYDESSSCLDTVGTMFADCMGSGTNEFSCKQAMKDQDEDEIKLDIAKSPKTGGLVDTPLNYGMAGSGRVIADRELNEANCIRLRAHCAKNVMETQFTSCFSGTAPQYQADVKNYIEPYLTCMESTAVSLVNGAKEIFDPSLSPSKLNEVVEKSRALGATDKIECKPKDGYTFCQRHETNASGLVVVAEPSNPTPADPMPELGTPDRRYGTPSAGGIAVMPNTCPGTILGDGVTVITSPTCEVMQNSPQMIIQSTNSTGQKVSVPATCEASAKSNVGDSVQCKLQTTQSAKPLYLLQSNNELKTCRTDGWVMSCPESFIEQSLQKRVKVLGVAGNTAAKPAEGYVHYNKRTGQLNTASVGEGVSNNGVMLEFQGKPVIAHTRAPASTVMATGDAYAIDKFVVHTSRTSLSPTLQKQGLPLMREISLGDK